MTNLKGNENFEKQPVVLFLGNARPNEYAYFKENNLPIALFHDEHCPIAYPPEGDFSAIITISSAPEKLFRAFEQLNKKYRVG